MSRLFGRSVSVSVGRRGAASPVLIQGLRIVFKIEKTLEKTPNNSTIEIYNLSPETRAIVEQKGNAVRLTAGYEGSAKDIFIGDVASVVTKWSGADCITSVEAADGLLAYQTKEADLSFAPGSTVGTVLKKLTDAFGLSTGEIGGLDLTSQYLNGASFSGKVRDHLDVLLGKQRNVDWSIQDNQLQILPKIKGSSQKAVLLTPNTGLVGRPFKRSILLQDISKKIDGMVPQSGCDAKSLINPEIVPGRFVDIRSDSLTGIYKVEKVTHSGDTHAVTYYSDIEGITV